MGAPRLFPKGNDRSWTREFYYAINRMFRRLWYENHYDERIERAMRDAILTGKGIWKV